MADLSVDFCGIKSPNPFWLASAPPTNSGEQVMRAFDAGWGGAVWKTLGNPIVNVSSRFGGIDYGNTRLAGLNNIELITDRPLEANLREMRQVKTRYPGHALIASLMVETQAEWREIITKAQDAGADGLELNFGCPHGMCERGMGSAVGNEPRVLEEIARWAVDFASVPVIVKLTPNVGDITEPGAAVVRSGAHAISLINTVKSLMGVDLERMVPLPRVGDASTNGGYCGPAVKPIALHLLSELARHPQCGRLPISGIGGISNWRDAAEFIALGSTTVQVCTAVMHYGFRIIEDLCDGLSNWMDSKGFASIADLRGKSVSRISDFKDFDLSFRAVARIDEARCIKCNLCYVACTDTAHQCIDLVAAGSERPQPKVREQDCVGCRLCYNVCPVENCISMIELPPERASVTWDELSKTRPEVTNDWDAMKKYRAEKGIEIH